MTLLALLIALTLGHFFRALGRVRRTRWLGPYCGFFAHHLGKLPALLALLLALMPVLAGVALMHYWLTLEFGVIGWFLVAVFVLLYSWGPRDLDLDVEAYLSAEDDAAREKAVAHLVHAQPEESQPWNEERLAESVIMCALERWFGVLFWFAVAGPVGALGYRLVCVLARAGAADDGVPEPWREAARRLRGLLDWPAAQLMVLGMALVSHFDPVLAAWRSWHRDSNNPWLTAGFLRASGARAIAVADVDAETARHPMRVAMGLVWRILFLWLTVLALLTIAGVAL